MWWYVSDVWCEISAVCTSNRKTISLLLWATNSDKCNCSGAKMGVYISSLFLSAAGLGGCSRWSNNYTISEHACWVWCHATCLYVNTFRTWRSAASRAIFLRLSSTFAPEKKRCWDLSCLPWFFPTCSLFWSVVSRAFSFCNLFFSHMVTLVRGITTLFILEPLNINHWLLCAQNPLLSNWILLFVIFCFLHCLGSLAGIIFGLLGFFLRSWWRNSGLAEPIPENAKSKHSNHVTQIADWIIKRNIGWCSVARCKQWQHDTHHAK